jgi:hypothetical protein
VRSSRSLAAFVKVNDIFSNPETAVEFLADSSRLKAAAGQRNPRMVPHVEDLDPISKAMRTIPNRLFRSGANEDLSRTSKYLSRLFPTGHLDLNATVDKIAQITGNSEVRTVHANQTAHDRSSLSRLPTWTQDRIAKATTGEKGDELFTRPGKYMWNPSSFHHTDSVTAANWKENHNYVQTVETAGINALRNRQMLRQKHPYGGAAAKRKRGMTELIRGDEVIYSMDTGDTTVDPGPNVPPREHPPGEDPRLLKKQKVGWGDWVWGELKSMTLGAIETGVGMALQVPLDTFAAGETAVGALVGNQGMMDQGMGLASWVGEQQANATWKPIVAGGQGLYHLPGDIAAISNNSGYERTEAERQFIGDVLNVGFAAAMIAGAHAEFRAPEPIRGDLPVAEPVQQAPNWRQRLRAVLGRRGYRAVAQREPIEMQDLHDVQGVVNEARKVQGDFHGRVQNVDDFAGDDRMVQGALNQAAEDARMAQEGKYGDPEDGGLRRRQNTQRFGMGDVDGEPMQEVSLDDVQTRLARDLARQVGGTGRPIARTWFGSKVELMRKTYNKLTGKESLNPAEEVKDGYQVVEVKSEELGPLTPEQKAAVMSHSNALVIREETVKFKVRWTQKTVLNWWVTDAGLTPAQIDSMLVSAAALGKRGGVIFSDIVRETANLSKFEAETAWSRVLDNWESFVRKYNHLSFLRNILRTVEEARRVTGVSELISELPELQPSRYWYSV